MLACHDDAGAVLGTVRVTSVDVGRSLVEPVGWTPADRAYRRRRRRPCRCRRPRSSSTRRLDGGARRRPTSRRSTPRCGPRSPRPGPGGTPSTSVRVVDETTASPGALRLRVGVPAAGTASIRRADGSAVVGDVAGADGAAARLVVSRLEHIAAWELVRALGDHPSPLVDAVSLDLFEARPGEARRPADRPQLPTDGSCVLSYARAADGTWLAPSIFIELHSHADRDLFVAVLDLTDRFRCHPVVPTIKLGAGRPFAVADGDPIPASLPAGRARRAGRGRSATGSR